MTEVVLKGLMIMKNKTQIDFNGLTKTTESTSAISKISYGLETAYHQGLTKDDIKYQIKQAKIMIIFRLTLNIKKPLMILRQD